MIHKRVGNKYHLGCPGCGKRTMILELDRPFDPAKDDIAYCDNRKTCPLPPKPMIVNMKRMEDLRVAQMRVSAAAIRSKGPLDMDAFAFAQNAAKRAAFLKNQEPNQQKRAAP